MKVSHTGIKVNFITTRGRGMAMTRGILKLAAGICIAILIPIISFAETLDAPHNESNNISCGSCHGGAILTSEYWTAGGTIDETPFNKLCIGCHSKGSGPYSTKSAPKESTHSSLAIDNGYGDWTKECTICHNPHSQEQKLWIPQDAAAVTAAQAAYDALPPGPAKDAALATLTAAQAVAAADAANLYLATGKIIGYSYDSETNTSVLFFDSTFEQVKDGTTYHGIAYKSNWNAARFLAKTSSYSKAILFPNLDDSLNRYSFVILSITDDPDNNDFTITVKGNVKYVWKYLPGGNPVWPTLLTTQTQFGIIYGQLIKQNINNKSVRFFDNEGTNSFADDSPSADGVCEVCHSQTTHYRQGDVVATHTKDLTSDPLVPKATDKTDCITCHRHEDGFAHRADGTGDECGECHKSKKHSSHMAMGIKCSGCHNIDNMRDGDGNVIIPDTSVCLKCHNNGKGGAPNKNDYLTGWNVEGYTMTCDGCHNGRPDKGTSSGHAPDTLVMSSDGHNLLVAYAGNFINGVWNAGRQYPCWYCHADTIQNYIDATGQRFDSWTMSSKHCNETVDVQVPAKWATVGTPYYQKEKVPPVTGTEKICYNTYCHSDGTTPTPEMRPYPWNDGSSGICNSCHGHDPTQTNCNAVSCHNDGRTTWAGRVDEWLTAMPNYVNTGPGTAYANSHFRHLFNGGSCDDCHYETVVGGCLACHEDNIPTGQMNVGNHLKSDKHVDGEKDVVFKNGGTYNAIGVGGVPAKSCSGTTCHPVSTPQWGGAGSGDTACLECHGATNGDVDDFGEFNGTQAQIDLTEWQAAGHGRPTTAGSEETLGKYPGSLNPAANFPINGCWYCHDPNIKHKNETNPFRLRQHEHFKLRFDRECAFCHMKGVNDECMKCHNDSESLVPDMQLANIGALAGVNPPYTISRPDHAGYADNLTACSSVTCHVGNSTMHNIDPVVPVSIQDDVDLADIKNSYVMMGVCLKCHDDDSGGQCQTCHVGDQYKTGFDPGLPDMGYIQPAKAKASSFHFGYKHFEDYTNLGIWKGGKFCWDCHDAHGDANLFKEGVDDQYNIYMIQTKIATQTDGMYGKPIDAERKAVKFSRNQSGSDYVSATFNGVCQVCHESGTRHYNKALSDGHNSSRKCTMCHEHRFTDSHASDQACDSCHHVRPVPRHTAFGLPRDCVKCHFGTVQKRMNVLGQLKGNSHHIQRADNSVSNKDCYQCHWEATVDGLINNDYHGGYNSKTYQTVADDKVDLVIWGVGARPTTYSLSGGTVTATTFRATQINVSLAANRAESNKVTPHCLGCHSDQNNDVDTFGDCKTPRQYAWDGYSIGAKYSDLGTAKWGKYTSTTSFAKKDLTKAYSSHGNAVNNAGGFSTTTGLDSTITNTRGGAYNVVCFDCHSSHGSTVTGITTSYVTFNGTRNGGNLKETQAGKGGFSYSYKASAVPDPNSVNPFNAGAGQCFDCHETATSNISTKTPWGYNSTFGATAPILGYLDNKRFSGTYKGITQSYAAINNASYPTESTVSFAFRRDAGKATLGGHMKASHRNPASTKNYSPGYTIPTTNTIDGLCTPCHDPHGISPTLGNDKKYGVPLLKGTYLTSPYKEDHPPPNIYGTNADAPLNRWGNISNRTHPNPLPDSRYYIDRKIFNDANNNTFISETDTQFAGLCLGCHVKSSLTNSSGDDLNFRTVDRIHESVKGWGTSTNEHQFPCSKCHKPHASGLPRLMQTNCLDYQHRGGIGSGGTPTHEYDSHDNSAHYGYPIANVMGNTSLHEWELECHAKVTPAQNPGQADWKTKQLWNNVTMWP